MSPEMVEALGAALDDGCSLADLEATLLASGDDSDQTAAAWLYAWAYEAIRPRGAALAARLTSPAVPTLAPARVRRSHVRRAH